MPPLPYPVLLPAACRLVRLPATALADDSRLPPHTATMFLTYPALLLPFLPGVMPLTISASPYFPLNHCYHHVFCGVCGFTMVRTPFLPTVRLGSAWVYAIRSGHVPSILHFAPAFLAQLTLPLTTYLPSIVLYHARHTYYYLPPRTLPRPYLWTFPAAAHRRFTASLIPFCTLVIMNRHNRQRYWTNTAILLAANPYQQHRFTHCSLPYRPLTFLYCRRAYIYIHAVRMVYCTRTGLGRSEQTLLLTGGWTGFAFRLP